MNGSVTMLIFSVFRDLLQYLQLSLVVAFYYDWLHRTQRVVVLVLLKQKIGTDSFCPVKLLYPIKSQLFLFLIQVEAPLCHFLNRIQYKRCDVRLEISNQIALRVISDHFLYVVSIIFSV